MITLEFENIDLRVMQQSNVISGSVKQMRGTMRLNSIRGKADFVEEDRQPYCKKNPIVWQGEYLTVRSDKEHHLRGTFRLSQPKSRREANQLICCLYADFSQSIEVIGQMLLNSLPNTGIRKAGRSVA
jgi:hypothetical protein